MLFGCYEIPKIPAANAALLLPSVPPVVDRFDESLGIPEMLPFFACVDFVDLRYSSIYA